MRIGIFTKDVKSQCLVRPGRYVVFREDRPINHQWDFVGGSNLENYKFKMADGRHLGNT